MKTDKVSIITPAYNAERFIAETIGSVLSQTYENWEMIVADDCSSDATKDIVREYSKKDKRIRLIEMAKNEGAAVARNQAIKESTGSYLAFLDSDDLWMPDKLEKQINYMKSLNIAFCYTAYRVIAEKGNLTKKIVDMRSKDCVNYYDMLSKKATIGCSTVILDMRYLNNIVLPNIKTGQDYALWLSILKKDFHAHCFREILTSYRIVGNSISSNKFKKAL